MSGILLADYSGGLNLRDSPNELGLNETPAALNWTLDERGAALFRNGCVNIVALPGDTGTPAFLFYSQTFDIWLCARKSSTNFVLYTRPGDFSGVWTSRGNLATANASSMEAAFVEFPGGGVCITCASPGNSGGGTYTYSPTTLTSISTTIRGKAIALWQTRLWVAGYPVSDATGDNTSIFGSKIGDPTNFTPPDGVSNRFRDVDADWVQALGIAAGGLIAFKKRSAYRVNDDTLVSYDTIDSSSGCVGARAIIPFRGQLYTWGEDGIYEWNGVSPGKRLGDKVSPIFSDTVEGIETAGVGAICGGVYNGQRLIFAYPVAANGNNTGLLEIDPVHEWAMKHSLASSGQNEISSFAVQRGPFVGQAGVLFAAVRDGDDVFEMFQGLPGKDDATNFSGSYKTPWLQPSQGKRCRIQRAQVEGLTQNGKTNTLQLIVTYGWQPAGSSVTFDLSSDLRGADAFSEQQTSIMQALGQDRAFQLELVASGGQGIAAIRSILLDPVPLER